MRFMFRRRYTFQDHRTLREKWQARRRRRKQTYAFSGRRSRYARSGFFGALANIFGQIKVWVGLILIVGIAAALILLNHWEARVILNGPAEVTMEAGSEWEDPGAEAVISGSIFRFLHKDATLTVDGKADLNKPGEYTITYTATGSIDEGSGKAPKVDTDQAVRTVTIVDTTPPVLTLKSDPDAYTLPGQPYEEEGYTATDNVDGDITAKVKTQETDGQMIYSVTDSSGNIATDVRPIVYDDRTAPEITLEGGEVISVEQGRAYHDKYSAADDLDGDLTDQVKVKGKVDMDTVGEYKLTYEVTDAHGNVAKATRVVNVAEAEALDHPIIYLTFDDGPGKYTAELMEILARNGVEATFFVTGANPEYYELIYREYMEGHTIGVHTFSHEYDKIYSSTDAFWEDIEKVQDLVVQYTGQRTNMLRFPGGSSNDISINYKKGIMTELVKQAEEQGYVYFDWNVISGDAGETEDKDEIIANILAGVEEHNYSIVLCHDIKEYTVQAMEELIQECYRRGYEFRPLTPNSFTAHHNICN